MSLLMDALRRAEQIRRAMPGAPQHAAGEGEPAPAPPAPEPLAQVEPPQRLELVEEPPGPDTSAGAQDEDEHLGREAARQLFEAKPPPSRRGMYFGFALLVLVAAGALAAYVWLETRPSPGIGLPGALRAERIAGSATAPPAQRAAAMSVPREPVAEPQPVTPPEAARVALAPPVPAAAPSPAPRAPPAAAAGRAEEVAGRAEEVAGPARIPIRLGQGQARIHPELARAHLLYGNGDLAGAAAAYERVLQSEPKNGDALRGLAALALRRDDPQAAQEYYLRALEADPGDAAAAAALIGLRGEADPVRSESRLKTLIGAAPHEAAAHFALGNLYAAQNRWHEAEQAYFNAHAAEPANPDYRYNLAVSLDHLGQGAAAIGHYRGAIEAAAAAPAAFDRSRVEARLRELERR
ncbi:MAG: hypothetical protein Fur0039_10340 [Rhodocyclaceae bacterium]